MKKRQKLPILEQKEQNCDIKSNLTYELGTALLHDTTESLPVDEETREHDESELADMKIKQRNLMLQIQQTGSQQRRSGRTVGPRQSVSNSLRNQILYALLECKDPKFTKLALTDIPVNRGGQNTFTPLFDNYLLNFIISQPNLYQLAISQMYFYKSVREFCLKVHSSLRSFHRTAVTESPDGVRGNFLAFLKKKSLGSALSVSTVTANISVRSDRSGSPVSKRFKRIQRALSGSDESDTPVSARPLTTPIKPGLLRSLGVESPVIRTEEYLKNLPDPNLRYTLKYK